MSKLKKIMPFVDFILLWVLVILSTVIAVNLALYGKALWHFIAAYWVVCSLRYWKEFVIKVGGFGK